MLVAVGSKTGPKLEAARLGFTMAWPDLSVEVQGIKVDSGVSEQPRTAEESLEGALNRARAVILAVPESDYGVGMEGGLYQVLDRELECGWVVVVDRGGRECIGTTNGFQMPPRLMTHVQLGRNLNEAMEVETGIAKIGTGGGFFGYQTNGHMPRAEAYAMATLIALARFTHPELW